MTINRQDAAGPEPQASPGDKPDGYRPVKNPLLRSVLLVCGWIAVVLGVIGIFLPLVPTTPFLLLAAACFLRSSGRFYGWLIRHPRLGPYLNYYLDGKGMPARAKLYTLVLIWCSVSFSAWLIGSAWVALALLIIAILISLYIGRLPVRQPPQDTGSA